MANGRIPTSELTRIHHPNPNVHCYMRDDAARAWEAMRQESLKRFGVDLYPGGEASAYRSYAQQVYFWNLYVSGRGNLAARPGTSNHGWGVACDLATPAMREVVNKIGAKYGWKKVEAPSEWWHVNYVGGYHPPKNPLAPLTAKEERILRELLKLRAKWRKQGKHLGPKDTKRRDECRRWLVNQRKAIVREAKRTGWNKYDRRRRANIIWHYTKKA